MTNPPIRAYIPRSLEPTGFRAWLHTKGYRLVYAGMTITAVPLEDNVSKTPYMVHQEAGQALGDALKALKKHMVGAP
jgi:hypothetical protein